MHPTDDGFDQISNALIEILPRYTLEEQRLGLVLYRLLVRGEPVSPSELGAVLGLSATRVTELLRREGLDGMVYRAADGGIVGFGGLAVVPMHHRLEVGDRVLYTWCAWDSLFIPEMLGRTATVASACPETDQIIHLTVTPDGIAESSHPDVFMSLVLPRSLEGSACQTMASFCHHVFFFASRAAGEAWTARRAGTFLVPLAQAFALGKRKNTIQFNEVRMSAIHS